MNKAIMINLGGQIFHIEEEAYELLKAYTNDIKRHFAASPDGQEVVADIENRVAELFTEILKRDRKQVLDTADVDQVTARMGSVADFESEEASNQAEPIRTQNASEEKVKRRLFRDKENGTLGGVCSGLGSYLEVDAVWIRLAFVFSFFLFSTGFWLYLILWIIMPEALTVSDRMAMKGEAATLNSIKKMATEKVNDLKTRSGLKNGLEQVFGILGSVVKTLLGIFRTLLGFSLKFLLILLGLGAVVGIVLFTIAFFSGGFTSFWINKTGIDAEFTPFFSQLSTLSISDTYIGPLVLSAFALAIIPLIGLLALLAKLIFMRSYINKAAGLGLLAAWLIALAFTISFGVKTGLEFKDEASLRQTETLTPIKGMTWYLTAGADSADHSSRVGNFDVRINKGRNQWGEFDEFNWRRVRLRIQLSPDSAAHLVKIFEAQGRNPEKAVENAQRIKYSIQQEDSVLKFDSHYELTEKGAWRSQRVELVLQVPLHTIIEADRNMSRLMREPHFNECFWDDNDRGYEVKKQRWIMTENGLRCMGSVSVRQDDL